MLNGRKPTSDFRKGSLGSRVAASSGSVAETTQINSKLLQQARVSGRLNLANRELKSLPEALWTLNEPPTEIKKDISFDSVERWWDAVELTRLNLGDNAIESIDERLGQFRSLTFLDIHNNKLRSLPLSIQGLKCLTVINLSGNEISSLPNGIFTSLPLVDLQLANNRLEGDLPPFDLITSLEILNLANNQLTTIPNVSGLKSLRQLDLSRNQIHIVSCDMVKGMSSLAELNLAENNIASAFEVADVANGAFLPKLTRLDLSKNKITSLALSRVHCEQLTDLNLSINQLRDLGEFLQATCATGLVNLELRGNKLPSVPCEVLEMKSLRRLDVADNDIAQLPNELGLLSGLNVLIYEGNPIRGLPRAGSTVALLKVLRGRVISQPCPAAVGPAFMPSNASEALARTTAPSQGTVLDLSGRKLTDIKPLDISFLPSQILLSNNALSVIPDSIFTLPKLETTLTTLNLQRNRFQTFLLPPIPMKALRTLDLSNNLIADISALSNDEMHRLYPSLDDLNLSRNRVGTLACLTSLPRTLSVLTLAGNSISQWPVDVARTFGGMDSALRRLDLTDNDLSQVPPELGTCSQLLHLGLEGNSFRVPRRAILSQGTVAVLEYLQSRMVA